jgi:hypothetical protein
LVPHSAGVVGTSGSMAVGPFQSSPFQSGMVVYR